MGTTIASEKVEETYERLASQVRAELNGIGSLLQHHVINADKAGIDWTDTGDLSYILGQLKDITEFLGGEQDRVSLGCPNCGEDRVDWLVWQDHENVLCTACGHVYKVS